MLLILRLAVRQLYVNIDQTDHEFEGMKRGLIARWIEIFKVYLSYPLSPWGGNHVLYHTHSLGLSYLEGFPLDGLSARIGIISTFYDSEEPFKKSGV
jgi:hypothetical protein